MGEQMKNFFCAAVLCLAAVMIPSAVQGGDKPDGKGVKIHVLGTLAGTEPQRDRHHTSWVLELANGDIYFFDAGENCGRAAYLRGLDLTRLKAVFISHFHADHTAGLIHLFAVVGKIRRMNRDLPHAKIDVYFPDQPMADVFIPALKAFGSYPAGVDFSIHLIENDALFDDGAVKVRVMGNDHVKVAPGDPKRAYSFRMDVDGRRIIYSGDVRKPAELDKWVKDGCDLLMMENGHHSTAKICERWKNEPVKPLLFIHHGREYLSYPFETIRRCREHWKNKLDFADESTMICL